MRKTDRERRNKWVRVLAVVLAILLIAGTLVSVLPIFEAFAEEEAVNRYEMAVTANLTAGTALCLVEGEKFRGVRVAP